MFYINLQAKNNDTNSGNYNKSIFMKIRHFFTIILILFLSFLSSSTNAQFNVKQMFQVNTPVLGTTDMDSCLIWHTDFTKLRKSFYFKNKIISLGKYGGFVAINPITVMIDQLFTEKLNSGFFTNAIVRNDTLIAEQFNELYYFSNEDKWVPYTLKEPILLFNIVFEDDENVIYIENGQEYGSAIFIYHKQEHETKIVLCEMFNPSVIEYLNGQYIISRSITLSNSFTPDFFLPIEKFQTQSIDSIILNYNQLGKSWYAEDNQLEIPKENKPELVVDRSVIEKPNKIYFLSRYSKEISATVPFSIPDNWYINKINAKRFKQNKNEGLVIIAGDSLFNINYMMYPSTYYNLSKGTPESMIVAKAKLNVIAETYSREINFQIDQSYSINSIFNDQKNTISITDNSNTWELPFKNDPGTYLDQVIIDNGHVILDFRTLRNKDQNYGIIEITDMEMFLAKYGRKL